MPKDQPAAEERRESRAVVNVTPEKAEKQQTELLEAQQQAQAPEAPKGRQPGSHPLVPIDAATAQELFFKQSDELQPGQRAVWDVNAYGSPVLHVY